MKVPDTSNLLPLTMGDALRLYWESQRREFSFEVARPSSGVLTITTVNGRAVVAKPEGSAQ